MHEIRQRTCHVIVALFAAAGLVAMIVGCGGGDGSDVGDLAPTGGQWTLQLRTKYDDFASAVAADGSGNIYIVGQTRGDLPGFTTAGGTDAYVRKLDSAGAEVWTRQFGTENNEESRDVAVNDTGNVYVVGLTMGVFPGQETAWIGQDAFVRKFDSTGAELWTRQFGTEAGTVAETVVVSSTGDFYVAGYTEGNLPGFTNAGGPVVASISKWNDAFVRKYDNEGNELWTRQFGDERHDEVLDMRLDGAGNLYLVGYTEGALPGQTSLKGRDAFLRSYDRDGNERWTRQFGSQAAGQQANEKAQGVELDGEGNIYVVGRTFGAFSGLKNQGDSDAFVRKYDNTGAEIWTRMFGSDLIDSANRVSIDSAGNIYVVGTTEGTIPGQKSSGKDDPFVRSYDSQGKERWTRQFGTRRMDDGADLVVSGTSDLYVVGSTEGAFSGQAKDKGDDMDSDGFLRRMNTSP